MMPRQTHYAHAPNTPTGKTPNLVPSPRYYETEPVVHGFGYRTVAWLRAPHTATVSYVVSAHKSLCGSEPRRRYEKP